MYLLLNGSSHKIHEEYSIQVAHTDGVCTRYWSSTRRYMRGKGTPGTARDCDLRGVQSQLGLNALREFCVMNIKMSIIF